MLRVSNTCYAHYYYTYKLDNLTEIADLNYTQNCLLYSASNTKHDLRLYRNLFKTTPFGNHSFKPPSLKYKYTHLASFISICWRISCRSWSLRTGKMFLSSSSCLLGLLRSFTARSSFLIRRGSVPVQTPIHTNINTDVCGEISTLQNHKHLTYA